MKRFCLALDLKDDPEVIRQYDMYHKDVWPEVLQSLGESGIETMRIYRTGNRLIMQLETSNSFSFEEKARMDLANDKVQEWETLMGEFQQRISWASPDTKWVITEEVFHYSNPPRPL